MTSRGAGGRPRNDWTRSRRRKLIRLYTLTTLNNIEIQKVLKADGFCPKERNIQTQLQSLFSKEYRRFRPKSNAQMNQRLAPIRRISQGRITKSKRYQAFKSPILNNGGLGLPGRESEGLSGAFRDYSNSFTRGLACQLSLPSSSDSFPTVSSRLMLDGSIVHNVEGFEGITALPGSHKPLPPIPESQNEDNDLDTSLQNLRQRLSRRSSSFIRRVYSILSRSTDSSHRSRFSEWSNPSWRSSWMSISSVASRFSGNSSTQPVSKVSDNLQQDLSIRSHPTKTERRFWDDIIDDSNLLPLERPVYTLASPTKRPCCASFLSPSDGRCSNCGWYQMLGASQSTIAQTQNLKSDYFGNTSLHFTASSSTTEPNLESILTLIDNGTDVCAVNTSGQTFMHVLNIKSFFHVEPHSSYVSLLEVLQSHDFPFSHRDVHGRTLAHTLAPMFTELVHEEVVVLPRILELLKIDLNSLDNFGEDAGRQLERRIEQCATHLSSTRYPRRFFLAEQQQVLINHRNPQNEDFSFRQTLSLKSQDIGSWPRRVIEAGLTSWVDIHGDTPIIALLKTCRNDSEDLEYESQLIGAMSHILSRAPSSLEIRDRKGYTALAIAAIRGSEPCVRFLVDRGANYHSRNYRGKGIIVQALQRMQLAKRKGDNRSYGQILTCINYLIDKGARAEPTAREEWILPALRNKVSLDYPRYDFQEFD